MTAASITRRRNDFLVERLTLPVEIGGASFAAPATGTITADQNSGMADGDTVTVSDGITKPVVYEYDKSSNGVAAGHVSWAVGTTAASNATALAALIAANQPSIAVVDNLAGVLTLTSKIAGSFANVALAKSSSSGVLAVTGMSGGQGGQGSGAGLSAAETIKVWTPYRGAATVDRVWMDCPAGFAADASNYWTISVKDGSTVLASWTTHSTGEGALTADTPVSLTIGANPSAAAADNITVVATPTGSPANFPPARLVIELLYGG